MQNTHRARSVKNGEWVVGKYLLVANNYHTIGWGEKWEVGWDEIDVKTLEELK